LAPLVGGPAANPPLLEALKSDPSRPVRRSAANHLGDIAKDHPSVAVDTAARWLFVRPVVPGPPALGEARASLATW